MLRRHGWKQTIKGYSERKAEAPQLVFFCQMGPSNTCQKRLVVAYESLPILDCGQANPCRRSPIPKRQRKGRIQPKALDQRSEGAVTAGGGWGVEKGNGGRREVVPWKILTELVRCVRLSGE